MENTLNLLFFIGQWLLLLPLCARSKNFELLKWYSIKYFAVLVSTVFSLVEVILVFAFLLNQENKFPSTSSLVFYSTILAYKILFINIGKEWPVLMKSWNEVNIIMESYATASNYKKKIKTVFISLCLLCLVEHLFFILSIESYIRTIQLCSSGLETYFSLIFKFIFLVIPYNLYLAIFAQIINWLWTVIWCYVDIFLISLFICFTYRLEQIENKIELMVINKVEDIGRWKEVREHFVKLTDLCFQIEHCISPLLLISFANKLYTVIYQLLGILSGSTYGIEYSTELINRFYYGFSFFYILLRLAGVIMFGSQIYTKNHDIAMKLFEAPGKIYNIEIDRFITHIIICPPAITGGKMFQLKKCLILKMISSIIIYELVIVKFNKY